MFQPAQETVQASKTCVTARRLTGLARALWVPLLAVLAAGWLAPATAQAGTVTIVDGPNTPPVGGVFSDGYIQAQLAASSLTITTTGIITGPDEIRVLPGAVITWTAGYTLTLDAGTNVVISGTIQHDGPANGAGGLYLLASEAPTGTVIVGTGTQTSSVAAGSRFGLTRVQAGNLVLTGGSDLGTYAQLGFHAINRGATYSVTGPISVTVSQDISATAGTANYTYVQIGHGGTGSTIGGSPSGSFRGAITVDAGGDVTFQGGHTYSYAQLGNGGYSSRGDHGGNHSLNAGGDVTFQAGSNIGYAQLGNGGYVARDAKSGNHRLHAGGHVFFHGGDDAGAYAQLGNGGFGVDGDHSGDHELDAGGTVTFLGGISSGAYAQLGNGGVSAGGDYGGSHRLDAGGAVTFQGGKNANTYAQMGNGGVGTIGDHDGDHSLTGDDGVALLGGSGINAYAQYGNGGNGADGSDSGDLALTNTGNLSVTAGSGADAYAMIGHGSDVRANVAGQAAGSRSGDITLRVGATAVFSGSQVGHVSADGPIFVTQGNTLIGVSQNDPSSDTGAGQLLVTGVTTTSFSSAPDEAGGELRFYIPRETSQQIPTNATFNGATFATANTIPPAQLAGFAAFGAGPYAPPYSFYLGPKPAPDVAVTKTVAPGDPVQAGDTLTYTVSFSNTGPITATNVVISDSLPSVLTATGVSLVSDTGVVITQTNAAPDFTWSVSDLGPGQGGQIVLVASVQETAEAGSTITNTVTISATDDANTSNNTASASSEVAPAGTLYVPILQKRND